MVLISKFGFLICLKLTVLISLARYLKLSSCKELEKRYKKEALGITFRVGSTETRPNGSNPICLVLKRIRRCQACWKKDFKHPKTVNWPVDSCRGNKTPPLLIAFGNLKVGTDAEDRFKTEGGS